MNYHLKTLVLCVSALLATSASAAPILQFSADGKLTGAKGVVVGGVWMNVEFKDGTCGDLFGSCSTSRDFFPVGGTLDGVPLLANAATEALLEQVLRTPLPQNDGIQVMPWLINGCSLDPSEVSSYCFVYTPYDVYTYGHFVADTFISSALVSSTPAGNGAFEEPLGISPIDLDTTNFSDITWAVWSLYSDSPPDPAAVPEPATLALMGMGLLGVAVSRYRKRKLNSRVMRVPLSR